MEHFDRVEQFIADVNLCLETSQNLCDRVCRDLRPLLYQPWPPKEKSLPKSGSSALVDDDVGNHGDAASLEEAEVLDKVERALVKAQKARDLQKKLNPLEELHQEDKTTVSPDDGRPDDEKHPPKPTSQIIDGQEFAIISQSALRKLFGDEEPQLPGTKINRAAVNSSKKTNSSTQKPRLGTAQARAAYSAKVPRPVPSSKSHFKTSSADIGKHTVNKPKANSASSKYVNPKQKNVSEKEIAIKGNINRGLPSKSSNDRIKKQINVENHRRPSHTKERSTGNQRNGNLKSEVRQNRSSIDDAATVHERQTTRSKDVKEISQNSMSFPNTRGQTREVHVQPATGTDSLARKTAKLKLSDDSTAKPPSGGIGSSDTSAVEERLRPFMLKRDGSDLKVPGKIKKLYSNIYKLRQSLSSEVESDQEASPSHHFLHRLESKFQSSSSSLSFKEIQETIAKLTAECKHLIHIAKTAILRIQRQSEETSLDSRYKIKILTQAIRTRMDELKVEIQNVITAEEEFLSRRHPRLPTVNPPSPPSDGHLCGNTLTLPSITTFLPVQHFQGCVTKLGSGQCGNRNFEYSNLKELQTLTTLQHDVQRLSLQIHFEKLIGEEILPILEGLEPSDSNFVSLYRSIYGVLCHGGELYPAVITDNIGNASDTDIS